MHLFSLQFVEPLQGGSEGIYIMFHSIECLKNLREGLPKGVIFQIQTDVFPPTITKTQINSQLEVITPAGAGGE